MNKTIGIGIGIAAVAIAVAFVYSYSIPESEIPETETPEENIAIEEKATPDVQTEVTTPGKAISIQVEDKLGVIDTP